MRTYEKVGERSYLRQDEHTRNQDEGPDELNGDRNLICRVVVPTVANLLKDCSKEETDGNSPLVTRNDGTSDPSRSTF